MRRFFLKRVGQSGQELGAAVLFSFILHAIILFASILMVSRSMPRTFIPPVYHVALVGPSPDMEQIPQAPPLTKAATETKKEPAPTKPKISGMPELAKEKTKKPPEGPEQPAGDEMPPPAAQPQPVSVAVATPADFRFPPYLGIIRDKIERNWNPPPGAKEAKARVMFRIMRTGRVADAKLEESSGNFYFDQAAMRAILASSPFPPLPEGVSKESLVFSVDLMERE